MPNTSLLQVRTNAADRERASEILEALGTNLSAVVNMLLKQIILTESIPFEVKLNHPAYTIEQEIEETKATMAMENMPLTEKEVQMLTDYVYGKVTGEELRKRIFDSVTDEDRGLEPGANQ